MPDKNTTTNNSDSLLSRYRGSTALRLITQMVLIGIAYGYISALHNENVYYPVPKSDAPAEFWVELERCNKWRSVASRWRPSPLWLPSYVLCKLPPGEAGIGISHTKSGYLFRSTGHLVLYRVTSALTGGVMVLGLGLVVLWIRSRKRA